MRFFTFPWNEMIKRILTFFSWKDFLKILKSNILVCKISFFILLTLNCLSWNMLQIVYWKPILPWIWFNTHLSFISRDKRKNIFYFSLNYRKLFDNKLTYVLCICIIVNLYICGSVSIFLDSNQRLCICICTYHN